MGDRRLRKGWFRDSYRHSLAAKGIKTSFLHKKHHGHAPHELPQGHVIHSGGMTTKEAMERLESVKPRVVPFGQFDMREETETPEQKAERIIKKDPYLAMHLASVDPMIARKLSPVGGGTIISSEKSVWDFDIQEPKGMSERDAEREFKEEEKEMKDKVEKEKYIDIVRGE